MMYTPLSTLLKKALFALSMLIPLLSATFPIQAGAPMQPAGMPGMPADPSQMTPEQIAEWERQLDQEIQAFVKTLPPEQQEQFHKDVEELTKVMEKMSEDELMEFVGSVLSENQTPATQPMPKPQPKP
ncbi:MAG TPA: hypothetical protein VI522_06335, partial [Gammaproteobacteria bacterium]|nr:hypothetical protein [Gammaproteobacteria bacterium]